MTRTPLPVCENCYSVLAGIDARQEAPVIPVLKGLLSDVWNGADGRYWPDAAKFLVAVALLVASLEAVTEG